MVRYRRNFIAGGTFFFTATLVKRTSRALTDHIDALRAAMRSTRHSHPFTIDAVVILTDGYNEDDHYNKLAALLSTISTNHDVRVFTIPFGDLADYTTLKTIAETTNGQLYDARNVYDVGLAFREALASF